MDKSTYKKRSRILALGTASALLLLAILIVLAKNGIGLSCLFYQITGLQCPGCGNSRAASIELAGYLHLLPLKAL